MVIDKLLKDNPSFHSWDNGSIANFGASDKVVKYIHSKLKPGFITIETGSGKTTVAFLLAGCKHTSISPNPLEEQRIRKYCQDNNIEADFTFVCDSSAEVLPALVKQVSHFDFVFIDGAHRYPFAEIDYFFTQEKLKVGGYMVVDDIQLPSVRTLYTFLRKEKNWTLDNVVGNTAFFLKHGDEVVIDDWQNQGVNQFYLIYSTVNFKIKSIIKNIFFNGK